MDRKERTEINIKRMAFTQKKHFLVFEMFDMRLFFRIIPKPLKQYTL